MAVYRIRILEEASRELSCLDKPLGRRIAERLHWLSDNLDYIRPEPLKRDFEGLYKFRIGDYRVIYEIIPNEKILVIHAVGHRKEIYRRR